MFRSDFLLCEPEYPDIQSRASMLLLYSILNTEKGVKNPFQCTNMNKKIDKKSLLYIMYMQTALNTWFWKSYLQNVSVCGTIHRQSRHSCFTLLLHLNFGRYKFIRQYSKHKNLWQSILRATQKILFLKTKLSTRTAKVSK